MGKNQNLHPSVQKFKEFVQEHPLLMKEVSGKRKTLQELFEEWTVLGPDHEHWQSYRDTNRTEQSAEANPTGMQKSEKNETLGQLFEILKRMNVQDMQNHIAQFSSVLANIQQVMQAFQRPNQQQNHQTQSDPFSFRRD